MNLPSEEKGGPKIEMLVARKGNVVWGVGDEEYVLRDVSGPEREKARLSKEEAMAKMKPLLAIAPPPSAATDAGAPKPGPGAGSSGKGP